MGRRPVTQLTLRNNTTVIVSIEEGDNIRKGKLKQPNGDVIIRSQNNRMISNNFIVDIQNTMVEDPSYNKNLMANEIDLSKRIGTPTVDKNSPGYKKYLEEKEKLRKKLSIQNIKSK